MLRYSVYDYKAAKYLTPVDVPTASMENARPRGEKLNAKSGTIFSAKAIANGCWYLFDTLVLFRMGTIYLHRFEDFAYCTKKRKKEGDEEIDRWRDEQQKEWDRLSTTVRIASTISHVQLLQLAN